MPPVYTNVELAQQSVFVFVFSPLTFFTPNVCFLSAFCTNVHPHNHRGICGGQCSNYVYRTQTKEGGPADVTEVDAFKKTYQEFVSKLQQKQLFNANAKFADEVIKDGKSTTHRMLELSHAHPSEDDWAAIQDVYFNQCVSLCN